MKPEIKLILEPVEGDVLPLTIENVGAFTCPPFSFMALSHMADGAIRPLRFDTLIDMKPGDRFRFDLHVRLSEHLTLRFDRSIDLYVNDQPVADNTLSFPKP